MNKNISAKTPPMGWNSYDYYDTAVTEEDIKANADYMAKHLKKYGWEYIVVDIEWYVYDAGSKRDKYQYIPFSKVEIDEYSRLLPCIERFPYARDGNGFKPLADYVHNLGLKFGIHIMRGIPRHAAHNHTGLLNTATTANEIADPSNICFWNPDMYGLDVRHPDSQRYYDSIFKLYAEWGVDFVKVDDICRMDMSTAEMEIKMIAEAIEKSGKEIVLSLSPGPALIEKAWHYEKYANMWRITDDFWDSWSLLLNMFERCEIWQNHVSEGCYPDCDMLPLGYLGKGFGHERMTNFTKAEQITMMTLWCIFRSPLMLGAELTKLDKWTLSLLTNKEVLYLLTNSNGAKQIMRDGEQAIWMSKDTETDALYAALFNLDEKEEIIQISVEGLGLNIDQEYNAIELWNQEKNSVFKNILKISVETHGARLYKLTKV